MGTTYGSVLVLNCNCQLMPGNSDGGGAQSSPFLKTMSITPAGTQHTLKGAIVNIAFLDTNLNPIQSTSHDAASRAAAAASAAAAAGGGTSSTSGNGSGKGADEIEDDFLNLESEFNYQTSNSIADNFGGSGGSVVGGNGSGANDTGNSSSSPSSTPTVNSTFVNPFANTPPPPPPSANSVGVTTEATATESKASMKMAKSMWLYFVNKKIEFFF